MVLKNFQQNLSAFTITNQTAGSFNLDLDISLTSNSLTDHKKGISAQRSLFSFKAMG
jgi:hypothetical protein